MAEPRTNLIVAASHKPDHCTGLLVLRQNAENGVAVTVHCELKRHRGRHVSNVAIENHDGPLVTIYWTDAREGGAEASTS